MGVEPSPIPISEAAEVLGISEAAVFRLIARGEVEATIALPADDLASEGVLPKIHVLRESIDVYLNHLDQALDVEG